MIETLPPELLSNIANHLPWDARLSLSATSNHIRQRLAPVLFRSIRITNDLADSASDPAATSLENLARQEWAQRAVQTVSFVGTKKRETTAAGSGATSSSSSSSIKRRHQLSRIQEKKRDAAIASASFSDCPSSNLVPLPRVVRAALSGRLFPRARTLRVAFDFGDFQEEPGIPGPGGYWFRWEHEVYTGRRDAGAVGAEPAVSDVQVFWVGESGPEELDGDERRRDEAEMRKTAQKEDKYPWRAFMAAVWGAVAEGCKISGCSSINAGTGGVEEGGDGGDDWGFKHLVVDQLIPKPVSTFLPSSSSSSSSSPWTLFLSRLETLEIGLWSVDNDARIRPDSMPGYIDFTTRLDRYFLSHCCACLGVGLSSGGDRLRTLTVAGHPLSPVDTIAFGGRHRGGDGGQAPGLPLLLPGLETLVLRYAVLSRELAGFLGRSKKLRRLELYNCHVYGEVNNAWPQRHIISWSEFFDGLATGEEGCPALCEVEIRYEGDMGLCVPYDNSNEPGVVPMETEPYEESGPDDDKEHEEEEEEEDDDDDDDDDEYATPRVRARRIAELRAEGQRRAFSYGQRSDYGGLDSLEEDNYKRFVGGEDDRAYRAMMERLATTKWSIS